MMNLLFSPSGRIGPAAYMKGMIIIGVLGALLALLALVSPAVGMIGSLVSLVLLYAFFALGIKRSHDAGKTGWLSITHFLLLMLVSTVFSWIFLKLFGLDIGDMFGSAMGGDTAAVDEFTTRSVIPSAIASVVTYPVTAYIVNMLNPHDPTPNQYGTIVDGATFD